LILVVSIKYNQFVYINCWF